MVLETWQHSVHQIPQLIVLDRRQKRVLDGIDNGLVEGHLVLQVRPVELGARLRLQQCHGASAVGHAGIVVGWRGNQLAS
jgi:hypothetical protein